MWRCTSCSAMVTGCPVIPDGGACHGIPAAMRKHKGTGHLLYKFDPIPGSPYAAYICCKVCGASGSQLAWQNLAGKCPGKWTSPTTQQAWSRLNRGKHPHARHGTGNHFFPGIPLPDTAPPQVSTHSGPIGGHYQPLHATPQPPGTPTAAAAVAAHGSPSGPPQQAPPAPAPMPQDR